MTVASLWKALDQAGCGQPVGEEDMIDPQRRTAKVNPWTFNEQQRREQRIEDRPSLAVDLSIWICESLTSTAMNDFNENPALHLVFTRTMKLLRMGIKLVVVIEGKRRIRAQNSNDTPDKFRRRRSGTTFWRACTQCETMLQFMGVPVVRAKAEGEALCALLNQQGIVDGVISNDGDCLLFGAKVVYTKFSIDNLDKGCVMRYDASSLYAIAEGTTEETNVNGGAAADKNGQQPSGTNDKSSVPIALSREDLVAFALLTGSDLAGDGIDKVGHKKATRFIRKCKLDRPLSVESAAMDELRSWALSVKPIVETVQENSDEEDGAVSGEDLDQGEEDTGKCKGKNGTKKKASCCSRCSHTGSKRNHEKHGCEVCGTEPGEPCYKLSTEDKFRKSLRAKAIALRNPKFDPTLVVNAYMRPNDNQLPASLVSSGMSSRKTLRMDYPRLKDFIAWRTIVKGHCLKTSQDFIKQSVSRLLVRTELFQNLSSTADKEHNQGGVPPLRRCARERPIPKEIMRKLVQNGIECYEVCWIMQATVTDKDGEGIDGYEFSSIEPQVMVNRQYPDIVSAFQKNPPKATKEQGDAEMQKRKEFLESLFQPAEDKLATKNPTDWDKDKRVFKQPAATSGTVPYTKAPPKEPKKHCKTGGTDVALLMHSLKIPPKSHTTNDIEDFDFSSIESGSLASKECEEEEGEKARDRPISPLKEPPAGVGPIQRRKDLPPHKQKPNQAGVSSDDQLSVRVLLPASAIKNPKHNNGPREVPTHVRLPTSTPHDIQARPHTSFRNHRHHQRRQQSHPRHQVGEHKESRRRKASTPNKRQSSQPKRSRQKSPRAPPGGQDHTTGYLGRSYSEMDEVEYSYQYLEGGKALLFDEAPVLKNELAFEGGKKLRFGHVSEVSKKVAFAEPRTKSEASRKSPAKCCRPCGVRESPGGEDKHPRCGVDMAGFNEYSGDYNSNTNIDSPRWCGDSYLNKDRSPTESRYREEHQAHQLDDSWLDHRVEDSSPLFTHKEYSEDLEFRRLRRSKGRGSQHQRKSSDPGREVHGISAAAMHAENDEYLDGLQHVPQRSATRRHSDVEASTVAQEYFADSLQDDFFEEGMQYDGDCDEPIQRERSKSKRFEIPPRSRQPNNENLGSIFREKQQSDGDRDHHQPVSQRRRECSPRMERMGPSNRRVRAQQVHKSRGVRSPPARKTRDGHPTKERALIDRGYPRANTTTRTKRRPFRKHRRGASNRGRSSMQPSYPRARDKRRGERNIHRDIGVALPPQPNELFYDENIAEPNPWTRDELPSDNHHDDQIYDERFLSDDQYSYDYESYSDDKLYDDYLEEESLGGHHDKQTRHRCDQKLRDGREHFRDIQLNDQLDLQLHSDRNDNIQHDPSYHTNFSRDEMQEYSDDASEAPNYSLGLTHGMEIIQEARYQADLADERDCIGRDEDERMFMADPETGIGVNFGRERARPSKGGLQHRDFSGSDHGRYDKRALNPSRRKRNGSPRRNKSSRGRPHRKLPNRTSSFDREVDDESLGRGRRVLVQKNEHQQSKQRVRYSSGTHDDTSCARSFATSSDGGLHQDHLMDDENLDQHCYYDDVSFEERM